MIIRLAAPEARALEAICRRQLGWDARLAARVVTSTGAVGVFTTPPLDVLAFVAVPTAEPVADADLWDVQVPLVALADALAGTVAEGTGIDLRGLPTAIVPLGPAPSLHDLPPASGWQMPMFGIAGDLAPLVQKGTAEFESRAKGLPPRAQEEVAEEIWDRPAFAGLPLRALHAAQRLGMINDDMSRVSAATCGPWKRFSTSRGQVFVHAQGPAARLSLHVVR